LAKPVFIELFSGSKSVSRSAALCGFETFTVDFNSKYCPDLCIDIMNLSPGLLPQNPFFVWASPDCCAFSHASGGKHMGTVQHGYRKYSLFPKTDKAIHALALLQKTVSLIEALRPVFYVIENPRGHMRHAEIMKRIPFLDCVHYCDFGVPYMKPTDLWHNIFGLHFPKPCYHHNFKGPLLTSQQHTPYSRSVVPPKLITLILSQLPLPK
jgi:hypothetical protein